MTTVDENRVEESARIVARVPGARIGIHLTDATSKPRVEILAADQAVRISADPGSLIGHESFRTQHSGHRRVLGARRVYPLPVATGLPVGQVDCPYRGITFLDASQNAVAQPCTELEVASRPEVPEDIAKNPIVGRHHPLAQRQAPPLLWKVDGRRESELDTQTV